MKTKKKLWYFVDSLSGEDFVVETFLKIHAIEKAKTIVDFPILYCELDKGIAEIMGVIIY